MRKLHPKRTDELREEYDLSRLKNPVRGKYYGRVSAGTNVVLLDPDVAAAFRTTREVNDTLRLLLRLARRKVGATKGTRRKPA
jgi:hypothetical protein